MWSVINNVTDKHNPHSYVDTYDELFKKIHYDKINLLEIGIDRGGSMKLWHDYFVNGQIYGVDYLDLKGINKIIVPEIYEKERIHLMMPCDAYDENFIEENFVKKNIKFDVMIDDGPHGLHTMMYFVMHYSKLLKENGIMVIEDVQSMEWVQPIMDSIPVELKPFAKVVDLRYHGKRYDDIMIVIDKLNR